MFNWPLWIVVIVMVGSVIAGFGLVLILFSRVHHWPLGWFGENEEEVLIHRIDKILDTCK